MKTLLASIPAIGHFNPILVAARMLEKAGHEAAIYTSAIFRNFGRAMMFGFLVLGSSALAQSQSVPLSWGTCPFVADSSVQCTSISVPLDYENPGGAKISIAVSRRKAAVPSQRRGVLLLNPGGPGGPGLDLPQMLAAIYPQSVLNTYDLIGFDPRGIEYSTPVSCGLDPITASVDFIPIELHTGFDATVAMQQTAAAGCGAVSGPLLPYITTANTARDMDQIRQALGEQKISYLGYSYGTYLGAVYASLFPNNTDRFVLDSNVDPQWVWRTQFREWGPAFALRFPDFLNYAVANDATYHLGTDPTTVENDFFALASKLYANPIQLPDGVSFDDKWLRFVTFSLVYNDKDFPTLANFWRTLENTPTASTIYPLFQALGVVPIPPAGLPADTYAVAGGAVLCGDGGFGRDVAQYQEQLDQDYAVYPITAPFSSNIFPCAFWPALPSEPLVPVTSDGPSNILMLQNLRDPGTPYWGATQMRADLGQRARMVSVDQGGHGVYELTPNQCANNSATDYLVDGTFPATDTYCPAEPTPSTTTPAPMYAVIHEMVRRMQRR